MDASGAAEQEAAPRRVLVYYAGESKGEAATTDDSGHSEARVITLRHPKTGAATCYLVVNGESLQELHWFKRSLSSWLIGDSVCEDGSLYLASPVDPVLLLLPILDQARYASSGPSPRDRDTRGGPPGEGEGVFRSLEEVLFVPEYPGYASLQSLWARHLPLVCQARDAGGDTYLRLDNDKTLRWLKCKVLQASRALAAAGGTHLSTMDEHSRLLYAAGMIMEYLPKGKWQKQMCSLFNIKEEEVLSVAGQGSKPSGGIVGDSLVSTPDVPASFVSPPPPGASKSAGGSGSTAKRKATTAAAPNNRKITSFFSRPR